MTILPTSGSSPIRSSKDVVKLTGAAAGTWVPQSYVEPTNVESYPLLTNDDQLGV